MHKYHFSIGNDSSDRTIHVIELDCTFSTATAPRPEVFVGHLTEQDFFALFKVGERNIYTNYSKRDLSRRHIEREVPWKTYRALGLWAW